MDLNNKIKEIIVVEGKNDTNTLQTYFQCDTIETGGDQVNETTLQRVKYAQEKRGVIIFTDPDTPGEHIRRQINEYVPGCKNAFIDKKKARTEKKVGVEHASKEDLWDSLMNCVTFINQQESLSFDEFIDLGLMGNSQKRFKVCELFHIGPCNGKTCFKRLNGMNVSKQEIEEKLNESANRNN
ncbi:ribonuclease M5 [Floccifex sp.]|uniref:ribonuclease M5 n=1 Tax=Floccifex sp. TaxID=2815810 RepID=UPI002A761EA6|nr:ribonuclease M5 [Floccifex sp.]MDY2958427.1 ribonuclease M5 [Floccifex sp.]